MTTSHSLEPPPSDRIGSMAPAQCEGRGHGKAFEYFQDRIRIFQSRPTLPRFLCVATTSSRVMAAPHTRKPISTSGLGAPSSMAVCASGIERLSDHQISFCGGSFVFHGGPCSLSPAKSDTSKVKLRAHLPPVSLETRHSKSQQFRPNRPLYENQNIHNLQKSMYVPVISYYLHETFAKQ